MWERLSSRGHGEGERPKGRIRGNSGGEEEEKELQNRSKAVRRKKGG